MSAIRDGCHAKGRDALRAVLELSVARGDLRTDFDAELALDVLSRPLFYRLLITGSPLDETLVDQVADPTAGPRPDPKRQGAPTMKIHAIQTGTVAIKTRQIQGAGHGLRRRAKMFLDREWAEPLPIYAFAIEHAEGVIVVDTGETARTSERDYFPRWHPFFRYGLREWVGPEEEIGLQLQRLGIAASDVRWVVLTHLHTDHAGGLHHFPHNEILVSQPDLKDASGAIGRLRGYPNRRFPRWFDPTIVRLSPAPYGPFPHSLPLTDAGDVTIIPLAGHTPGQVGVVVEDGDHVVLLAGDSSYTEDLMLQGVVDGPSPNDATARRTHARIRALAAQTPTVYLVAHDPQTANRLTERTAVVVERDATLVAA